AQRLGHAPAGDEPAEQPLHAAAGRAAGGEAREGGGGAGGARAPRVPDRVRPRPAPGRARRGPEARRRPRPPRALPRPDERQRIRDGELMLGRRDFLQHAATGLGGIALASLCAADETKPVRPLIDPSRPLAPRAPHFAPKAKRVVTIFVSGALSHV